MANNQNASMPSTRIGIQNRIAENLQRIGELNTEKTSLIAKIGANNASRNDWKARFSQMMQVLNTAKALEAKKKIETISGLIKSQEVRLELIPGEVDDLKESNTIMNNTLSSMDDQDETLADQGLTREGIDISAIGSVETAQLIANREADLKAEKASASLSDENNRNKVFLAFGIAIGIIIIVFLVRFLNKKKTKKNKTDK
jgi:hypothetical protein